MSAAKPAFMIAVTGGSGSGKTTLAAIIQAALMDGFFTTAAMVTDSVFQFGLAMLAIAAALTPRSRWMQVAAPAIWVLSVLFFLPRLLAALASR